MGTEDGHQTVEAPSHTDDEHPGFCQSTIDAGVQVENAASSNEVESTAPTDERMSCVEEAWRRRIGTVLQTCRKQRGWTRQHLLRQCKPVFEVTQQTLGSWETGTRTIPLTRLIALCDVLDVHPADVLDRAGFGTTVERQIMLDLAAVCRSSDPRLRPLHSWARVRMAEQPNQQAPAAAVKLDAFSELSFLAGIDETELISALLTVQARHATRPRLENPQGWVTRAPTSHSTVDRDA